MTPVPAASRYDGISTSSTFSYTFELQDGVPVDGGRASLRNASPFTMRLVPPDALLDQAQPGSSIDLVRAASIGSSRASVASAIRGTTVVGSSANEVGQLQAFVAAGKLSRGKDKLFAPALADALTAADAALQLRRVLDAPPLTLLVNPSEFSVQRTKIQSYQSVTRQGYVFEAWGEDQPTISISGSTGGFYAGSPSGNSPSGLSRACRRDSAAWQNFTSLVQFYKNNGYIYDLIGKSKANLFIGHVAIDYDQWTYLGHFESMSYTDDAASPHRVTFEMEFKVSRMYDLAQASYAPLPLSVPTSSGVELSETPIDLLGGAP